MPKIVRKNIQYNNPIKGDTISLQPRINEGIKIADYNIDNATGALYAINVEGNNSNTPSDILTKVQIQNTTYHTGTGDIKDIKQKNISLLDSNYIGQIQTYKDVSQTQYDNLSDDKLSDNILYCINNSSIEKEITPNSNDNITDSLGKLQIGDYCYKILNIEANPNTSPTAYLSNCKINENYYDIGMEIIPNINEQPTDRLETIKFGSEDKIYNISEIIDVNKPYYHSEVPMEKMRIKDKIYNVRPYIAPNQVGGYQFNQLSSLFFDDNNNGTTYEILPNSTPAIYTDLFYRDEYRPPEEDKTIDEIPLNDLYCNFDALVFQVSEAEYNYGWIVKPFRFYTIPVQAILNISNREFLQINNTRYESIDLFAYNRNSYIFPLLNLIKFSKINTDTHSTFIKRIQGINYSSKIPITKLSGTLTASSYFTGFNPEKAALDNTIYTDEEISNFNNAKIWRPLTNDTNPWILYTFNTPQVIKYISMYCLYYDSTAGEELGFYIEKQKSDGTWETINHVSCYTYAAYRNSNNYGFVNFFPIELDNQEYDAIRIRAATTNSSCIWGIGNLQIYGYDAKITHYI